jgi:hypothetical protein
VSGAISFIAEVCASVRVSFADGVLSCGKGERRC